MKISDCGNYDLEELEKFVSNKNIDQAIEYLKQFKRKNNKIKEIKITVLENVGVDKVSYINFFGGGFSGGEYYD